MIGNYNTLSYLPPKNLWGEDNKTLKQSQDNAIMCMNEVLLLDYA